MVKQGFSDESRKRKVDEETSCSRSCFDLRSPRFDFTIHRSQQDHPSRDLEAQGNRLGRRSPGRHLLQLGTMDGTSFRHSADQDRTLAQGRTENVSPDSHVLRRQRRRNVRDCLPESQEKEIGRSQPRGCEVPSVATQGRNDLQVGARRLRHGRSTVLRSPGALQPQDGGDLLLD